MRQIVAFVVVTAIVVPCVHAQQLPLPSFDGVTAYYRAGRMSVKGPWERQTIGPCPTKQHRFPTCGWGFEAVYVMTASKQDDGTLKPGEKERRWSTELAVGYDFLNFQANPRNDTEYTIYGSMQTLPSISIYGSWDLPPHRDRRDPGKRWQRLKSSRWSVYGGIGTGIVVLKNVRAYDHDGNIIGLSGDTWGFTPSAGVIYRSRTADERGAGLNIFVEFSYEFRNFPSITYDTKKLPPGLPQHISAKGPVINIGIEIKFRKKAT
jgi:hypothetical protein